MTDEHFWNLLDQARGRSVSSTEPGRLKTVLNLLSDDEVSDFGLMFYRSEERRVGKECSS